MSHAQHKSHDQSYHIKWDRQYTAAQPRMTGFAGFVGHLRPNQRRCVPGPLPNSSRYLGTELAAHTRVSLGAITQHAAGFYASVLIIADRSSHPVPTMRQPCTTSSAIKHFAPR